MYEVVLFDKTVFTGSYDDCVNYLRNLDKNDVENYDIKDLEAGRYVSFVL